MRGVCVVYWGGGGGGVEVTTKGCVIVTFYTMSETDGTNDCVS